MTVTVEEAAGGDDQTGGRWVRVCRFDQLTPDRGVAALLRGQQIAIFRLSLNDQVYAISNRDPFSGANVLSRGIVGDRGGVPKVASPLYKQSFDLRTGQCLDDSGLHDVEAYETRVDDEGWVEVEVP